MFAADFAEAYCRLSTDHVRAGKDRLERAGVTYPAGTCGPSILRKLAAQDEAPVPPNA